MSPSDVTRSTWSGRTHPSEGLTFDGFNGTINILGGDWQNAVYRVNLTGGGGHGGGGGAAEEPEFATNRLKLALRDGRGLALEHSDVDATHGKRAFMIRMTTAAEAITVEINSMGAVVVVGGHHTLGYSLDNVSNESVAPRI